MRCGRAALLLLASRALAFRAPQLARARVTARRATPAPSPPEVHTALLSSNDRTLRRVVLPVVGVTLGSSLLFAPSALALKSWLDVGQIDVIGHDQGQYFQNIINVNSLLFTILVGYTYVFVYGQTEALFKALYAEVSVAKSLLEQVRRFTRSRSVPHDPACQNNA